MALLTTLVLAFSLADGHRIQPVSLTPRKPQSPSPSSNSPLSTEEEEEDNPISLQSEMRYLYNPNIQADLPTQTDGDDLSEMGFNIAAPPVATVSSAPANTTVSDHNAGIPPHDPSPSLLHPSSLFEEKLSTTMIDKTRIKLMCICAICAVVSCFFCICPSLTRLPSCLSEKKRFAHLHNGRTVYEWDQNSQYAKIYIRPPEGLKKRDLEIKIAARHLRVGRKGKPAFLLEETYDLVDKEASSWSLRSNGELQILLQKVRRVEWPAVLLHKSSSSNSGTPSLHSVAMNSQYKVAAAQQNLVKPPHSSSA